MASAAGKKGSMEISWIKRGGSTPPPPPRPTWAAAAAVRPRAAAVRSVTRDEIERYWRRKKMEEEDHLLAALKAAARIRARNLKEDDYKQFEASVEGILNGNTDAGKDAGSNEGTGKKELRAVIRDWWTKSRYAYLNQPAVQSMEQPEAATKRTSTYIPSACFYPAVPTNPCSALGVF